MIILDLAPLDAFKLHPQLLHQADGFHPINRFGKNLMGIQVTKGIIDNRLAGFIGKPLPPVAPVIDSAHFIDTLVKLVK